MTSFDRTLIIAEAGVNHNGDMELARQLVDSAHNAGADVVKFQTFRASQIATEYASQAPYQQKSVSTSEGQYHMLKRLELNHQQHIELLEYCNSVGILFLSTAFDLDSIDLLATLIRTFGKFFW